MDQSGFQEERLVLKAARLHSRQFWLSALLLDGSLEVRSAEAAPLLDQSVYQLQAVCQVL